MKSLDHESMAKALASANQRYELTYAWSVDERNLRGLKAASDYAKLAADLRRVLRDLDGLRAHHVGSELMGMLAAAACMTRGAMVAYPRNLELLNQQINDLRCLARAAEVLGSSSKSKIRPSYAFFISELVSCLEDEMGRQPTFTQVMKALEFAQARGIRLHPDLADLPQQEGQVRAIFKDVKKRIRPDS